MSNIITQASNLSELIKEHNNGYNTECPVCFETKDLLIINCNHSFCINCLYRMNKCALCRKPTQKSLLCQEIKRNINNSTCLYVDYLFLSHNERIRLSMYGSTG